MVPPFALAEDKKSYAQYLDRVNYWCLDHQDEVISVFSPGKWPDLSSSALYHIQGRETVCVYHQGELLFATLVNAVHSLDGLDTASTVWVKGLCLANPVAGGIYCLERVVGTCRSPIPPVTGKTIPLVLQQTDVVFVLRLFGLTSYRGLLDHVICFDAGEIVVWYCNERFEMNIKTGAIDYCVGDGVVLRGITEIRQGKTIKTGRREEEEK